MSSKRTKKVKAKKQVPESDEESDDPDLNTKVGKKRLQMRKKFLLDEAEEGVDSDDDGKGPTLAGKDAYHDEALLKRRNIDMNAKIS